MTKVEIFDYIKKLPHMKRWLSEIYVHDELSWEKPSGLNTLVCVYSKDDVDDVLIAQSGLGHHNPDIHLLKTHQKQYNLNDITPELLDKIVNEDLPALYGETKKDLMEFLEKQKLDKINEDFV